MRLSIIITITAQFYFAALYLDISIARLHNYCTMTQRQFLKLLKVEADKVPTRRQAAERLGISESALSRVLRGKQSPSDSLLDQFGLKSQVFYIKKQVSVKPQIVDNEINSEEIAS